MSTTFTQKAETSAELVISEKFLDDSKNQRRTEMINSYLDMIDWLMMFHKQPHIDITEENIKNVQQAYIQTNKIQTSIDAQEVSLKSQRDEIEKKLLLETRTFFEELTDVKNQVDKFKEHSLRKKEDDYNKQIDKINKTLV